MPLTYLFLGLVLQHPALFAECTVRASQLACFPANAFWLFFANFEFDSTAVN